MQMWLVDRDGEHVETTDDFVQVTAGPDDGNIWTCATCDAEATTKRPRVK
jgi:hypothetical protein